MLLGNEIGSIFNTWLLSHFSLFVIVDGLRFTRSERKNLLIFAPLSYLVSFKHRFILGGDGEIDMSILPSELQ